MVPSLTLHQASGKIVDFGGQFKQVRRWKGEGQPGGEYESTTRSKACAREL